jgi:hypothetical protein
VRLGDGEVGCVVTVAVSVLVLLGELRVVGARRDVGGVVSTVPAAVVSGVVTRTEMTGNEAPEARVSAPLVRWQDSACPTTEQLQPVRRRHEGLRRLDRVGDDERADRAVGAALLTASDQVKVAPATGDPLCDFTIRTSAESMRVTALPGRLPYWPRRCPVRRWRRGRRRRRCWSAPRRRRPRGW